ncbi:MAG: sulfatase [Armatimonadota bacterium]
MLSNTIVNRKKALQMLAGAVIAMNKEVPASRADTPNIIVILTDDQGFGDIGVYGAKGYKTPHLDRMAAEGRRFTNFHVAQPVCGASRAALLTGCYPNRLGLHGAPSPGSPIGIASTETTLAQLLKQRGYATGMAGKWHLGDQKEFLPTHRGFDEYFGLPYSNDMWPLHPEVPERYPPLPLIEGDRIIKNGLDHGDQEQLTTQYTERAVRFIERHKEQPFFFYLAHNMPHVPLHVSKKFKGKSERGLYGDVIEEIDWSVGEVLKTVERCGIERDTLVMFLSDNGPWLSYGDHAGSAGPLREGKGTSWEGGTRVPFLALWPGRIPAGSVSDEMLCSIDLFPTIARLTGSKLPDLPIDGLDVWPTLSGQPGAANSHTAYFWYYEQNQLQAVSTGDGRWKLVLPHAYRTLNGRPGGTAGIPVKYETRNVEKPELYDLSMEVSERIDIAAEHPEIVERLLKEAEKARADMGDALTNRTGSGLRKPGRVGLPES